MSTLNYNIYTAFQINSEEPAVRQRETDIMITVTDGIENDVVMASCDDTTLYAVWCLYRIAIYGTIEVS